MSSESLVTRELLFTYFAGQATALQKQMIEKWVEEGPDNEEFFYSCLHEWEMMNPQYAVDTDAAISQFHESITGQASFNGYSKVEQVPAIKAEKSAGWRSMLVAASVVLALLFGAWLLRDSIFYKSYVTDYGQISRVTLMDGSRVVLNANSVLQVPRFGFGELSRNVRLRGEARFSVVHTPDDKKFVVLTDSVFQVEVLGTEFNLSARQSGTKVVLQEGKVKLLYQEGPSKAATALIMAPGDLVTVNEKQKKLQVKQVQYPENYSAWRHGRFVFDNTSLVEIKDLLQDNYGLLVELKGVDLSDRTVSGSFQAKGANELLQALSEILDINVIRQNDHVLLIGKG